MARSKWKAIAAVACCRIGEIKRAQCSTEQSKAQPR